MMTEEQRQHRHPQPFVGGLTDQRVGHQEKQQDRQVTLELHVDEDDMGKVIGRQGRIAKAMRTVVKAAATRENKKVSVDIIE